jgi:hypothetical protein
MARLVVLLAVYFAASLAVADEPALKPDPPAKPVAWPAAMPDVDLPAGRHLWVTPADHAGPFVAVSQASVERTPRTVFDLRTGKQVGEFESDLQTGPSEALSSDGKLLVTVASKIEAERGRPSRRFLAGFDVASGKRLWETEITGFPPRVRFVGPDKVVVDPRYPRSGEKLELYDARTGRVLRTLTLGQLTIHSQPAGSPGGRYVAVVERDGSAVVLGAGNGAVVARLALPETLRGKAGHCRELAFSPDGRRLAAVFPVTVPGAQAARVVSWDLATGKPDADAHVALSPQSAGPPFSWSADSTAWLMTGAGVIDPDTGTVLWKIPGAGSASAAHLPIAAHRIVRIDTRSGLATRQIQEVALPKDRVAAALKAVRTGGLAVDGWLPALAKADRSAAQAVAVPPRADDWTYQPDPAPATTPRKPLRLPLSAGRVESAHVVGPAAVFELVEPSADLLAPRRLVRVNLATGKPTGTVELPHVTRLADVAPDGAAALTVDSEDGRRVDVWDLGTGRPVAGWRPALVREPGGELQYASLLSADRVLTLTRGGELAVWSVPGAKAVYTARVPGLGVPTRSPGRKYLFALQGDVVRVIEATTGQLAGDLPADAAPPPTYTLPPGPWARPPLAVRPDGKELAALLAQPAGTGPQVRRWDLTTAKLTDRSPYPGPGVTPTTAVRYAGPDHLLVADTELFGLTSRAVEWRYVRPAAVRPAASADGRYWYVADGFASPSAAAVGAAAAAGAAPAVLVAAELPHPTAVAALKAASNNTADNLLGPGKTVGLKLDLTDAPNDKVRESVLATLADALAARGLRMTDGKADVVLTASARVTPGGPKLTVRKLLPGEKGPGTAESVAVPYLATRLELTADGRPVWTGGEVQMPPPLNPQPFRLPDKDTDLTAWLRERAWARLSDAWGKLNLPRTLVRTPGGLVTLPGTSELGPDGPRPR